MVDHNKVKDKETHTIITYDTLNSKIPRNCLIEDNKIKSEIEDVGGDCYRNI